MAAKGGIRGSALSRLMRSRGGTEFRASKGRVIFPESRLLLFPFRIEPTMKPSLYSELPPLDPDTGHLNVLIDTAKGSRNKFKYNEAFGLFKLSGVMPAGAVFPFDFGYVPGTLGEDGDPVDVLVLMDEAAYVGAWIPVRLIGVIEAEQTEAGKTERNDRLIGVTTVSRSHVDVTDLGQLNANLVNEIEHFFVSYNEVKGKEFKPLGRSGPGRARELLEAGIREHEKREKSGEDANLSAGKALEGRAGKSTKKAKKGKGK